MREQLIALRRVMKENGVDIYLVPSDDFHSSEYVSDFFKCRRYVSGFTGSAGTLVVMADWAGLWTDGRYFLQAAAQLENSGIELMKIAQPGVPSIEEFLKEKLLKGMTLGFDGRTYSANAFHQFEKTAKANGAEIRVDLDLVGDIWEDRPPMPAEPVDELALSQCGRARADKLAALRRDVAENEANAIVLSTLMDICWLLNIRGGDVACTPVVLSFFAMTEKECVLFVNPAVMPENVKAGLAADGVEIRPYGEIYDFIAALPEGTLLEMNLSAVNSRLLTSVPAGVRVINKPDPTQLPKAAKNPTEVANFRVAHIKDGVAITRLMYWLKTEIGRTKMTERSVSEKLEEFRSQEGNYMGPSFGSIVAYGPNSAMCHYDPTQSEQDVEVEPRSFLLADVGAHFPEGTTDTTRTFAMGPLTDEEKTMYTLVLQGHMHLGAAHFLAGSTGMTLDYLAREPLWKHHMDFNHGTGHGVGYLLSVHEGPQSIFYGVRKGRKPSLVPLEEGMIISDEPGIYLEGKFGVRCENLTVVCNDVKNEYGQFMHFEHLTMVPWDLDAIDFSIMTDEDKRLLNTYHEMVRKTILPLLPTEAEKSWLVQATREV